MEWDQAVAYWKTLHTDADASFDSVVELDATLIVPQVTWGTSPEMVLGIDGNVPDPDKEKDANKRGAIERALSYMGLEPEKASVRFIPGRNQPCAGEPHQPGFPGCDPE